MNLYKISQSVNKGYNTYDSAIVAAPDKEKARMMHPNGVKSDRLDRKTPMNFSMRDWVVYPSYVTVELIGVASEKTKRSVILASFNAG
tara:strand:- start:75 stop:338 length:264 start_codon:yes stop_codon:yes gene_type:complete